MPRPWPRRDASGGHRRPLLLSRKKSTAATTRPTAVQDRSPRPLPSPSPPMPSSAPGLRLRSMPCHACSDAQLPSPSPPMQSKTVALAPMPASMPSRSRLPLAATRSSPAELRLQAIPPAAVCIEFASRRSAESARKPVMELAAVPICPLVRSPPSDAPQHSRAGEHRRPHHAMDRQLSARQYRGRM